VSDTGGRYQRSMSGMIGALVVTLVAITGFVAWRAINRDDLEVKPDPVDYLGAVRNIQEGGQTVVYPPTLPSGWIPTSANYRPGRDTSWDVGILTSDNRFAGLSEQDASVEQLVENYVDADADEGPAVELQSPLARSWRSFTDSGGDYAVATEIGEETLLVYGSADPQQIRELAASLVSTDLG
jgi:hypothetical protein